MTIQAVNSINFTGKSKTKEEYTKSNIGKYAGTGLGLATGLATDYFFLKDVKKPVSQFKRAFIQGYNDAMSRISGMSIKDTIEDLELGVKQFRADRKKAVAFGIKFAMVALPLLCVGIALGVGALADKFINKHRAKNADKTNQTIQTDNAKADNATDNTANMKKYWNNEK